MDRLVRMFHGGIVKENGEFEKMNEQVELFISRPSLKDVVERVMSKYECAFDEDTLRGRFDCGKARSHYVLLDLSSESHWNQYKEIVAGANVACFEVIVDICRRPNSRNRVENANIQGDARIPVENLTQESNLSQHLDEVQIGRVRNVVDGGTDPFDLARICDDFDVGLFEEEEEHVDDDGISMGSEGGEDQSDEVDAEVEINDDLSNGTVEDHVNEVEAEEDAGDEGHDVHFGSEPALGQTCDTFIP
ncbi:unnamed protein product [Urochloa humidicola]